MSYSGGYCCAPVALSAAVLQQVFAAQMLLALFAAPHTSSEPQFSVQAASTWHITRSLAQYYTAVLQCSDDVDACRHIASQPHCVLMPEACYTLYTLYICILRFTSETRQFLAASVAAFKAVSSACWHFRAAACRLVWHCSAALSVVSWAIRAALSTAACFIACLQFVHSYMHTASKSSRASTGSSTAAHG
eukprot:11868-Heterococcus_DN1.PRE.2